MDSLSISKRRTVLCVDDEPVGLTVRKAVLEHNGYQTLTAESGPRALEVVAQTSVDLAIIDFYMPEMKGDVLAAALRARHPSVPIIMHSAFVDLPAGALLNCDACIVKGEPPKRLLDTIERLLAGAA